MTLANIGLRAFRGGDDIRFTATMKMKGTPALARVQRVIAVRSSDHTRAPRSRNEGFAPAEGWLHSSPFDQSKNGYWHLGDADRINANGEPHLAFVHDELLFEQGRLDTT